ncbi:Uncharacterised protein [Halioglobus japonicus]|nr:Uncharacterised protein [Halioglobus japonicus]
MNIKSNLPKFLTSAALITSVLITGCMRVEIDNPIDGEFIEEPTVTVSGNVFSTTPDDFPLNVEDMTLEINGSPIPIAPDGSYSTNILLDPLSVFNAIEADILEVSTGFVDSYRTVVIAGDSIPEGEYSPEAIALQINASGLDSLSPVVASLVDLDPATLMPTGTTVANNVCVIDGGFLGCLGRATIKIDNPAPSISGFGVDFTSQQNSVHSDIVLNNLQLNVHINGSGLAPNCDLRLKATRVTLGGNYALEPDGTTPTRVDVYQLGGVSTAFTNFDQEFTSGICDVPLIGDLIQLIVGNVRPMVEDGLEGFLNSTDGNNNTPIAAAVESALGGVDVSGSIGQALNAQLDAPFFQVKETTGGITMGSNARFVTNFGTGPGQCNPPAGAPDLTASYHVPQPFPNFGSTTPGGTPYEIGMGISSSGFNQLLRSMVECGLLVATITELDLFGTGVPIPLTAGLLANFIPELNGLDPSFPARIAIKPTMAPLITGAPGPAGELALLKIAQLHLKVEVDVTFQGETGVLDAAEMMMDADVGIDLTVDESTGSLVFELAAPSPFDVSVKSVENPLGANLASVEALLPHVVGSFLPALAGGLGGFPLPSFLGLSLDVVEVARNGEMLTIYADLN